MKDVYSKSLKEMEVGQEIELTGEVKVQSLRVCVSVIKKKTGKVFTVSKKPECVIVRRVA